MRKARGRRRSRGTLSLLPTAERLVHGPIERMGYPIEDATGEFVRPLRALDTLTRMERAGTIGEGEVLAGYKFHSLFRRAALDQLFAADPTRVLNVNGKSLEGSEGARLAVRSALDALGGPFEPPGSLAWCVLGLEMSLRTWIEQRTPARGLHPMQASGILVADLAILRVHFNC